MAGAQGQGGNASLTQRLRLSCLLLLLLLAARGCEGLTRVLDRAGNTACECDENSTSLRCAGSDVVSVPPLAECVALDVVNLAYNHIEELPENLLTNLTNLRIFDVRYNLLTRLPDKIFHGNLSTLARISLNHNYLTEIKAVHFADEAGMSSLRAVFMGNNSFTSLPARLFYGVRNTMQSFSLSKNENLTKVEATTFEGLTQLEILYMARMGLTEIPTNLLKNLTNLFRVNLSFNKISKLDPDTFLGLPRLWKILLNDNLLTEAPLVRGLDGLEVLQLHNNNITKYSSKSYDFALWSQFSFFTTDNNPSFCFRMVWPATGRVDVRCDCASGYYGIDFCDPMDGLLRLPSIVTAGQPVVINNDFLVGGSFTVVTNHSNNAVVSSPYTLPLVTGINATVDIPVTASAFETPTVPEELVALLAGNKSTINISGGTYSPLPPHALAVETNENTPTLFRYFVAPGSRLPPNVTLNSDPQNPQFVGFPSKSGVYFARVGTTDTVSGDMRITNVVMFSITDCGTLTCANGGTCVDQGAPFDGQFVCECTPGFGGVLCRSLVLQVSDSGNNAALIAGATIAGLAILGLVLFLLWYCRRTRRRAREMQQHIEDLHSNIDYQLRAVGLHESDADKEGFLALACARGDITMDRRLGAGFFGQVNLAQFHGQDVAVKMVKGESDRSVQEAFLLEARLLHALAHPNVVACRAHVTDSLPMLLVLEYMGGGDLIHFLRECSPRNQDRTMDLSPSARLSYSMQIAAAMAFVESRKVVHRDLAARNVLVSSDYKTVKLSDFGMSRQVESSYYKQDESSLSKFPVKWSAPESIVHHVWSPRSDVWSFGVLMWEIETFGAMPYSRYDNAGAMIVIAQGGRLPRPRATDKDVYKLMHSCWSMEPKRRPAFADLLRDLTSLLTASNSDSGISTAGSTIHGTPRSQRAPNVSPRASRPSGLASTPNVTTAGRASVANASASPQAAARRSLFLEPVDPEPESGNSTSDNPAVLTDEDDGQISDASSDNLHSPNVWYVDDDACMTTARPSQESRAYAMEDVGIELPPTVLDAIREAEKHHGSDYLVEDVTGSRKAPRNGTSSNRSKPGPSTRRAGKRNSSASKASVPYAVEDVTSSYIPPSGLTKVGASVSSMRDDDQPDFFSDDDGIVLDLASEPGSGKTTNMHDIMKLIRTDVGESQSVYSDKIHAGEERPTLSSSFV